MNFIIWFDLGRCILTYWNVGRWNGAVKCPSCRQLVSSMLYFVSPLNKINLHYYVSLIIFTILWLVPIFLILQSMLLLQIEPKYKMYVLTTQAQVTICNRWQFCWNVFKHPTSTRTMQTSLHSWMTSTTTTTDSLGNLCG